MSLDWPPPNLLGLAPPEFSLCCNHIHYARHLVVFRSQGGGAVWDSNVFLKSVTYRPTLSKFTAFRVHEIFLASFGVCENFRQDLGLKNCFWQLLRCVQSLWQLFGFWGVTLSSFLNTIRQEFMPSLCNIVMSPVSNHFHSGYPLVKFSSTASPGRGVPFGGRRLVFKSEQGFNIANLLFSVAPSLKFLALRTSTT